MHMSEDVRMSELAGSKTTRRSLRALWRDRSGLAMLEFAFAMPVVMAVGAYGLEITNLALLNMRVSQIALSLADNASRVGGSMATQQLREADINDVLQAARYQGTSINLTTNGRITLSSLENVQQSYDTTPVQRIHWQRCLGIKSGTGYDVDPTYATTTTDGTTATSGNDGTAAPSGMGDPGALVTAPVGSGVMFVEVNYLTKPLFGTWLTSPARIHYVASFIVRDKRDYAQIYNPSPTATLSTCNLHTS
jgi:Flp pilus assembly protein TadG